MRIENIRKKGIVRHLKITNYFFSNEGNNAKIFMMPSRKELKDDAVSILVETMNTKIEFAEVAYESGKVEKSSVIKIEKSF